LKDAVVRRFDTDLDALADRIADRILLRLNSAATTSMETGLRPGSSQGSEPNTRLSRPNGSSVSSAEQQASRQGLKGNERWWVIAFGGWVLIRAFLTASSVQSDGFWRAGLDRFLG
jgi:hypothetical protein